MLNSVLTTDAGLASVTALQFMECTLASIVLGVFCAIIYMYRNRYNKSFVVTLALMPLIVQLVIMLVNGNLGAGVAVMGAFSLVRFRSIPGTAKDSRYHVYIGVNGRTEESAVRGDLCFEKLSGYHRFCGEV